MLESQYQSGLIKELERLFPGCVVLKNDTDYQQGVPDLLVLYRDKWAMLEVKAYEGAPEQPNQDYWVERFDGMSFAAFIFPENEEEVLYALSQTFRHRRSPRAS